MNNQFPIDPPVKPIPLAAGHSLRPGTVPPLTINAAAWVRRFDVAVMQSIDEATAKRIMTQLHFLKRNIVDLERLGHKPVLQIGTWETKVGQATGLNAIFAAASDLFDEGREGEDPLSIKKRQVAVRLHRGIRLLYSVLGLGRTVGRPGTGVISEGGHYQ